MKSAAFLLIVSSVLAFPQLYIAPNGTDSRGPCPALNTLANHGYLPREGRNITLDDILSGAKEAYSLDHPVLTGAWMMATKIGLMEADGTLSLENLARHPAPGSTPARLMEHDMSLSRVDANLGDNVRPNMELIDQFLARSSTDEITVDNILEQYHAQYRNSKEKNLDFVFTGVAGFAAAEGGVIVPVFGNDDMTSVSKDVLSTFLKEERIMEGWQNREARGLSVIDEPLIRDSTNSFVAAVTAFEASSSSTGSNDDSSSTGSNDDSSSTGSNDASSSTGSNDDSSGAALQPAYLLLSGFAILGLNLA